MSRAVHLKIKIKYLAVEARIIKKEEQKVLAHARKCNSTPRLQEYAEGHYVDYEGLREHRLNVVRKHSRLNGLAYGFLRGTPYAQMEAKTHSPPDFGEIRKLAKRFGAVGDLSRWDQWLRDAERHLELQWYPERGAA